MLSSSSLQHAKTGPVAAWLSLSEDRALNRREQTCKKNNTFSAFQNGHTFIHFNFHFLKILNSNHSLKTQQEALFTPEAGVARATFPPGSPRCRAGTSLGGLMTRLPWLDGISSGGSAPAGLLRPSA